MINLQVIPFEELLQWKEKIQEELDRRDLYAFDITVKALFELHPEKKVLVLGMSYKAYDALMKQVLVLQFGLMKHLGNIKKMI